MILISHSNILPLLFVLFHCCIVFIPAKRSPSPIGEGDAPARARRRYSAAPFLAVAARRTISAPSSGRAVNFRLKPLPSLCGHAPPISCQLALPPPFFVTL